ncbi:MAG: hypothetical protein ACM65M_02310 [Microcoleus sp.]
MLCNLLTAAVGAELNFELIREILVFGRSIVPIERAILHRLDE